VHRAQADALELEAMAKRRLADEYDAAQDRGEVATAGGDKSKLPEQNFATVSDIGLTHKEIHDARQIRDAEAEDPGIVRRTLDAPRLSSRASTPFSFGNSVPTTLLLHLHVFGDVGARLTAVFRQ
jgi:hypothetical protein